MAATMFLPSTSVLKKTCQIIGHPAVRNISYKKVPWHIKQKAREDVRWTQPIINWRDEQKVLKEQEPSPLHLIFRVKTLKNRPYWEKRIANDFGIGEKTSLFKKIVVRNSPSVNEKMKKIMHLIQVVPVTMPHGLPESESDLEHCFMRDNGEFVVKKRIGTSTKDDDDGLQTVVDRGETKWAMDKETLAKHCQEKLTKYDLNAEHFKPRQVYKYNQDKKEHRYFGDKAWDGRGRNLR